MFPGLDLNGDGLVTRNDFLQAGSSFGPAGMAIGGQLFNQFDTNRDGVLNAFEGQRASMALGGGFGPRPFF
jgi:hypothetical protein